MYLASRLTKFEPTDWNGRVSGSKAKWWEDLIEGMSMELMEGGAGSPVCVCGGGSLRVCPWNPWKVGLVISLCVQGGSDLI